MESGLAPMSRVARFKAAQDSSAAGFASALEEIRSGAKRGHWIWYVFPQLSGLGTSGPSRTFAIDGEAEAAEYLRDPELRSRLATIATAVAAQLRGGTTSLRVLMGSDVDARKLVSSLTLFGGVARKLHQAEPTAAYQSIAATADEVLAVAAREGYPTCAYTLARLQGRGPTAADS